MTLLYLKDANKPRARIGLENVAVVALEGMQKSRWGHCGRDFLVLLVYVK